LSLSAPQKSEVGRQLPLVAMVVVVVRD